MFALVESGSITKYLNGNKGITLDDLQYPRAIYTLWTEAERNAHRYLCCCMMILIKKMKDGISIQINLTLLQIIKSQQHMVLQLQRHTLILNLDAQDETDGLGTEGEVAKEGLKYNLIRTVKAQAAGELAKTDWYITRKAEKSTAIPSAITTHRNLVRSRQAAMETSITNASDTPALETLYTYTTDSDGVHQDH